MRGLKTILIIVGIVCLSAVIYGFITLYRSGGTGAQSDFALHFIDSLDLISSYIPFRQKLGFFCLQRRWLLSIVGGISLLVGLVLPHEN